MTGRKTDPPVVGGRQKQIKTIQPLEIAGFLLIAGRYHNIFNHYCPINIGVIPNGACFDFSSPFCQQLFACANNMM